MGAGYGLSNNWGYNNYTSYLGYGGAGVGVGPYQATGLPTYSSQVHRQLIIEDAKYSIVYFIKPYRDPVHF